MLRNIEEILKEKMRTSVFIAHRLRTIANSDKIIVLDQGEVEESGTHAELLSHNGNYARMWREQAAAEHNQ